MLSAFEVSAAQDVGYRASNSVSGTRVNTPIMDLPLSLQAFTEDFIRDVNPTNLFDIVRFAPGVTYRAEDFMGGNSRFAMRGFDTGDGGALRNGLPGLQYVDPANLARIEVVKGPASFLYGQIAPGGIVNVITKRPQSYPITSITGKLGTDDFWRADVDVNIPATRDFGLRLVGAYENSLRYWDAHAAYSWNLAPSVAWQILPNLRALVEYDRYVRREDGPLMMKPNIFDANFLIQDFFPLPQRFNFANESDFRDRDLTTFLTELGLKIGEHWNARAVYNRGTREVDFKLTGQAGTGLIGNVPATGSRPAIPAINAHQRRYDWTDTQQTVDTYLLEFVGNYAWEPVDLRVLAGYQRDESEAGSRSRRVAKSPQQFAWDLTNPTTWSRHNPYQESDYANIGQSRGRGTNESYYAGLTLALLEERLRLLGGLRRTKVESQSVDYNTRARGPLRSTSNTSPQVGALYKLTEGLNAFASYSESFVPNFAFLRVDGVPTTLAEPTEGKGYEVGLKTELWDGRLSSTVSAFQIDNTNIIQNIIAFVNSQTVFTDVQSGVQRSQGFEIDAVITPRPGLQIYTSYSYIDATIHRNPANPAFEGRRLQASARHLANLWVRQDFKIGDRGDWYVTAGANHTGSQHLRAENPNLFRSPYTLFDVALGYQVRQGRQGWLAELALKNVFDKETFPSNNTRGLPRRVVLTLNRRF